MPNDPIDHVVVLMLENRSFDQMLGALQAVYPNLDGIDPATPRSNSDGTKEIVQEARTTHRVDPDPRHELEHVLRQIEHADEIPQATTKIGFWRRLFEILAALIPLVESYRRPRPVKKLIRMIRPYKGDFVGDFVDAYGQPTDEQKKDIMGYFPLDSLPAHHSLARNYTICDRWYSSVPGPTWANRFFVHTGTSLGRVWMPATKADVFKMRPYDQVTLYDRLTSKGVNWKIYFGDIPQSFVLTHQLERQNILNYRPLSRFFLDASGDPDQFPDYCLIEPSYFYSNSNDDHPPHNAMAAQCLTADVYNAIRNNPELWKSTLLVVVYDEHGGFFDHVEPPLTICPDDNTDEYKFNRLGVRVPAILVSPWVKRGVQSTQFDHASLLRYVSDKWSLGPLCKRVADANSISAAIEDVANPDRLKCASVGTTRLYSGSFIVAR